MEQQRSLNALEPYLALSKSATSSRAAADLITQATSAPQTYVFAELLQTPQIQNLRTSDHAASLRLLEIFSWGTYHDYTRSTGLPSLNEAQTTKLRLLSLLPLLGNAAAPHGSNLRYDYLAKELQLDSDAQLEALLTKALSTGLIAGHLDPAHRLVAVTSVAPLRDLPPNSVPRLSAVLGDWDSRCDGVLKDIEAEVQAIRDNAQQRGQAEARRQKAFETEVEKDGGGDDGRSRKGSGKRTTSMMGNDGMEVDAMDVDEGFGGGKSRGVKKIFSKGGKS